MSNKFYPSIEKYLLTYHLDVNDEIAKRVKANVDYFNNVIFNLDTMLKHFDCEQCDDIDIAIRKIEEAKDLIARVLAQDCGTIEGEPFKKVFETSCNEKTSNFKENIIRDFDVNTKFNYYSDSDSESEDENIVNEEPDIGSN